MAAQDGTAAGNPEALVGFIGTGDMGGPMARNLLRAGYPITVFDIDAARTSSLAEAGASVAGSVAEVAANAAVVLSCVNSVRALRDIANTIADTKTNGGGCSVFVDHSTSGPSVAAEIADQLESAGVAMLDAPISGMIQRAADGTLSIMVSGPEAAYETTRPLLEVMGAHIYYLGDTPGAGQMVKVANNLINNVQTLATCEALAMGMKFGLKPEQLFAVFNTSTGRNSQTEGQLRSAVLENDFSKGAVMTISQKDITLAVEEAHALGVLAASAEAARDVINTALAAGGPEQRSSGIFRYVAGASGLEIE